jgi:hypothetical protein
MPEESSFEYKNLEADMQRLADQIRLERQRPVTEMRSERQIVKEAIRVFPNLQGNQNKIPAPAAQTAPQTDASQDPLPDYAKDAPAAVKLEIEYLCDVALRKGIATAMSESERSPYFVQDAFHDALAGKLYPELQKRGIVNDAK